MELWKELRAAVGQEAETASPLLVRACNFLDDGDTERARAYFERVLDEDPKAAAAYAGLLLAAHPYGLKGECVAGGYLTDTPDFTRARDYAAGGLRDCLCRIEAHANLRSSGIVTDMALADYAAYQIECGKQQARLDRQAKDLEDTYMRIRSEGLPTDVDALQEKKQQLSETLPRRYAPKVAWIPRYWLFYLVCIPVITGLIVYYYRDVDGLKTVQYLFMVGIAAVLAFPGAAVLDIAVALLTAIPRFIVKKIRGSKRRRIEGEMERIERHIKQIQDQSQQLYRNRHDKMRKQADDRLDKVRHMLLDLGEQNLPSALRRLQDRYDAGEDVWKESRAVRADADRLEGLLIALDVEKVEGYPNRIGQLLYCLERIRDNPSWGFEEAYRDWDRKRQEAARQAEEERERERARERALAKYLADQEEVADRLQQQRDAELEEFRRMYESQ